MRDGMEKGSLVISRKQHILICALAGLLILGGVLGLSAHSDLQNAEKQFEDTISYVKEQCTGYDNLNLASETKSLMRTMPPWKNICRTIPSVASLCFRQRAKSCAVPHRMAGRLTRRSGHRWKRNCPVLSY